VPRNTPERLIPGRYREVAKLSGEWRFTTAELEEYDRILAAARVRLNELERAVFDALITTIAAAGERLRATARALAAVDVQAALADVAIRGKYIRPELTDGPALQIVAGRHPVVEQTIADGFVPNDTTMDADDAQLLIITGPNMAGKSTYLRQVALIVLLAQIGAYVPADAARIGLVDRIFTRIGAQDDIATGQSTFMVEMTETASILHHATPQSLIVLDELGRGTSTYDGLAIAYAVLEYLHEAPHLGARTLFATHFHELTKLADRYARVRNYHVAVAEAEDHVVFLRRILPGPAERSFGIHVAQMAGLPEPVLQRAAHVLAMLEKRGAREQQRAAIAQVDGGTVAPEATDPQGDTGGQAVLDALDRLDADQLTPREALAAIHAMQALRQTGRGAA
jgi:DNA mismatch repair protein MutS